MGTYSTIRQRQPLRVPNSFNDQEKQLVIQLEGVFDDIYKHFGRLGMDDMSSGFRFVIDNKYDRITGITIDEDGIDIVGDKYVSIQAGDGGKWTYDEEGLWYYKTGDPLPFQIARYADKKDLSSGVYYNYSATGQTGEIILLTECVNGEHVSPTGYWRGEIAFAMTDSTGDLDTDGKISVFYPREHRGSLGTRGYPWSFLFCRNILGQYSSDTGYGVIAFCPNPAIEKRQMSLNIQQSEYIENGATKDRLHLIPNSSLDMFVIQGNASVSNQLIGFDVLSGIRYINGRPGYSSIIIKPNPSGDKSIVRLYIGEIIENNKQLVRIYKDTGVDELQFIGNVVGNASTATVASTANNLRGADGMSQVLIRPNATKSTVRLAISESVENNKQVIKLFKDSGVDELQFFGNASTATKLSRAPTYGELSGR